jgi:hypothetical protein
VKLQFAGTGRYGAARPLAEIAGPCLAHSPKVAAKRFIYARLENAQTMAH